MLLKKIKALFGIGKESPKSPGRTGIIKYFNFKKGYGFIIPDDGGDEIFVHVSEMKARVRKGSKVSFQTETTEKGINAVNVVPIKKQKSGKSTTR